MNNITPADYSKNLGAGLLQSPAGCDRKLLRSADL